MKKLQVEGWKVEKLGNIAEIIMGQSPDGSTYNSDGNGTPLINGPVEFSSGPFSKTIRSKFTTSPTKYCQKGDLIICVRGSTTGRTNIAGFDACIGRGVAAIRYTKNQDWVNWFILSRREQIYKLGTGATFPNISSEQLSNLQIPIPPLPEQQRIVSLLDETFAGLAQVHTNAERNLVNAREVFEAVLEESVVGKDSRKWKVDTVGKVSEHSLGKMLDKQKNRGNFQKYLRNINVRWFDFDLSDVNEMRFLEEEKEKYTAIKGDLLICEGGYPGRAAIWEEDYPIYFQKAIHRVRFEKNVIPKWFLYCLYSADLSGRLKKYLTGTGIQHFTGQALDRFEFPIPPLEEQCAIVERLDALAAETSRLEAVYQSKLEAVEELRKSVLGKAFEGEL